MIIFRTTIGRLEYLMNVAYLLVPAAVVKKVGGIGKQRLICTVNGLVRWQCGLVNLSGGDAYISFSKERMRKANATVGGTVEVKLEEDKSEFGTAVPEELTELLMQDEEGKVRFDLLKPAMKRYLLNHIGGAKSTEKRIERAVTIITNLKNLQKGKETFREMLGKPPL